MTHKREEELAAKMPPGTVAQSTEKVVTNIYGVRLPDIKVYKYEVGVVAITTKNKPLDMTKPSRDELVDIFLNCNRISAFSCFGTNS